MNMKLGEIPRRIDSDFKTRKANLINPGVRGAPKIGEKKSYSPIKYFENAARGPAVHTTKGSKQHKGSGRSKFGTSQISVSSQVSLFRILPQL